MLSPSPLIYGPGKGAQPAYTGWKQCSVPERDMQNLVLWGKATLSHQNRKNVAFRFSLFVTLNSKPFTIQVST